MVRRLSITVPDQLWDELIHLDSSPSALVQRALRCLHATEGPGAGPTPIEAAAADIPYWQHALDNLTDQATELRAEGYEAVIMGTYEGVVTLGWLEMVERDYHPDELPQLLADAGDVFLAQRHRVVLPGDEGGIHVRDPLEHVDQVAAVVAHQEELRQVAEQGLVDRAALVRPVDLQVTQRRIQAVADLRGPATTATTTTWT